MSYNNHNFQQQGPEVVQKIVGMINKLDTLASFKGEDLVNTADKFGKHLKDKGLKTSQIRKFLDAVKKMKYQETASSGFDFRNEAMLIKPKLAYASGRQDPKSDAVKPLMEVMNSCIDKINGKEDFDKFYKFVEAIVAYHKYYGGKEL